MTGNSWTPLMTSEEPTTRRQTTARAPAHPRKHHPPDGQARTCRSASSRSASVSSFGWVRSVRDHVGSSLPRLRARSVGATAVGRPDRRVGAPSAWHRPGGEREFRARPPRGPCRGDRPRREPTDRRSGAQYPMRLTTLGTFNLGLAREARRCSSATHSCRLPRPSSSRR